jgi:hypothetical protein
VFIIFYNPKSVINQTKQTVDTCSILSSSEILDNLSCYLPTPPRLVRLLWELSAVHNTPATARRREKEAKASQRRSENVDIFYFVLKNLKQQQTARVSKHRK